MNELRILIFSATFGAGHIRAAEALSDSIYQIYPNVKITHLDFGDMLNKKFNAVLKKTYLGMIKYTPKLWGAIYYGLAKIPTNSELRRMIHSVGQKQYLQCINSVKPDIIICTYPTVAGVLSQLRLKHLLEIPVVTVVTDYVVHSQWIHKGVDLYIVGCNDVKDGFISRGIEPARIKVTGIPVNPKFECKLNRIEVFERLGLNPNMPTILVMGGAYGVLDELKGICEVLADISIPSQTIVVCGHDLKLYNSINEVITNARNPMLNFGFVRNVEEFMTAADIVITKAGGLIVSEALTKRVPILIYRPIPGQEEKNAFFLENSGAGRCIYNRAELAEAIYKLLQNPKELMKMRQAAVKAYPGKAAERAANYILQLLGEDKKITKVG
jgi:processive 1,2-diacylglycerol beta-glucosyltransferase